MASEMILTDEGLRALLDKKVKLIQTGFDRKVRDMKPFVLEQACQFIREQTKTVTKMLTRTHHMMVSQFIEFKLRTEEKIKKAD